MNGASVPIRVLIADDHPLTRVGIRAMLESHEDIRVVAEACDGEEVVASFRTHTPDVVLMDLCMPKLDGLEATSAIRAERPDANIVIFTSYPGDARVSRALRAGAISYLLKTAERTQIFAAIFGALQGKTVLDETLASEMAAQSGSEPLSWREISVLRMVAQGTRNADIGLALSITEQAVKARMRNVLLKLNANDRAHAVYIARARGFINC
jgi:DNA-binding NarL/FixJ family response regulator